MAPKLKSKKPELILNAVSFAAEKVVSKKPATIYEYDILKNPDEKNKINVFRRSLAIRGWFIVVSVNVISMITLLAIGYAVILGLNQSSLKMYGDYCNVTSDCSTSDYLMCVDNKCVCPNTRYYNDITCLQRLGPKTACTSKFTNECADTLGCYFQSSDGKYYCDCSTDRFYDTSTSKCKLKYGYTETGCTSSDQCQNNKNMLCTGSVCTCSSTSHWNGTYCKPIATYLEACSVEVHCDTAKLLNCSVIGQDIHKCVCPYTHYWSSALGTCTLRSSIVGPCTATGQCREDVGLVCTSGACACLNTHYWNSTYCVRKIQYNQPCTSPTQCDNTIGLTMCTGLLCKCPSLYFYNGTGCQFELVSGLSCNSSFACDLTKSLICNTTTYQCICPVNYYWDYSTCATKKVNTQSCAHTIQCRSDLGLYCDTTTTKTCICLSTHYWSGIASGCLPKGSEGASCTATSCQDYNGLSCVSTFCRCATNYYWNSTICLSQVLFNEACTGAYASSMCMASKGLICSAGVCRCSSTANYWDSTNCVAKLDYGNSCQFQVTTLTNPQCDERSPKFLICLATPFTTNTYTCQCPSTMRWVTSSCVDKVTYKGSCPTGLDAECEDYNGLICHSTNKTCLCPTTKYWDSTNTICKDKLGINSPCTFPLTTDDEQCQDYAWLYCNSNVSGSCQCPADRYYNSAYKACLPRASHDQYCGDGTLCMPSSPRPLTCSASAGNTCQCENYRNPGSPYYWSPTEKNCRACQTGYLSGYGDSVQSSIHSITTRCYKIEYSTALTYTAASTACTSTGGHLMNIRSTMEMAMAADWSSGTRDFWLEARYMWTGSAFQYYWSTWASTVLSILWCRAEPSVYLGSYSVYIHGDRGDCLDHADGSTTLYYICEIGA